MSEKNWQVSFVIRGLVVPEDGIRYGDDIIIKRCGKDIDEAQFIMRVTEGEVKETVPIKKFERDIANILQLYALEAKCYIVLPTGYAAAPISDEKPFGGIPPKEYILKLKVEPKDLNRIVGESSSALKYALRAYESLKRMFEDGSKLFLRHGLKYYHMALGEEDVQREIIDLFVALEALFSAGRETRFRTSLRIATFLSLIGLNKKEVYDTVYELYETRSKIVHGTENVDVSWDKVFKLRNYLRDCFRIFLYLDKAKDEVNEMLDDCLIDEEVKSKLKGIIVSAYERWKKEKEEANKEI